MLSTPILLIIFNRPELTVKVFEAVRQAAPKKLLIAADGPRTQEEKNLTDTTRLITEQVDWPCEVLRHYSNENMGCKMRPYTAISWAFEHTKDLIILEDDCLPHPDFFVFCEEMLHRFRNEKRVMHISGDCFLPYLIKDSYYFTNYTHVWGWATNRNAWHRMELSMKDWSKLRESDFLLKRLHKKHIVNYWTSLFDSVAFDDPKIWDYQWTYSVWKSGGLAIAPSVNLISNIGFGSGATHTHNPESFLANKPVSKLVIKTHPETLQVNAIAEGWITDHIYCPPPKNILQRLLKKLKQ